MLNYAARCLVFLLEQQLSAFPSPTPAPAPHHVEYSGLIVATVNNVIMTQKVSGKLSNVWIKDFGSSFVRSKTSSYFESAQTKTGTDQAGQNILVTWYNSFSQSITFLKLALAMRARQGSWPPYLFLAISPNTTPLSFLLPLKAVSRTNVVCLWREGMPSPLDIHSWRKAWEAVILSSGFTINCKIAN